MGANPSQRRSSRPRRWYVNTSTRGTHWRHWHTGGLLLLLLGILLTRLLPTTPRLWTWLGLWLLLALFALIVGNGITGLWLGVLIDSRNKVSLSRFQLVLWTVMILSGYLTAVLVNLDLGHPLPLQIAIPPELWVLMGISTTSLVGSPLLLNLKRAQPVSDDACQEVLAALARQAVDPATIQIQGQVVQNALPEAAQWSDLFRGSQTSDAGQVDLGKLQLFFFTLVLALAYGAALLALFGRDAGAIVSLPVPDGGTLALLGISHAGYLASKANWKAPTQTAA